MKGIKSNDKVLLIGITNQPWNSMTRKMQKCYKKFLLCPFENYADKFLLWRNGIQHRLGFIPNVDCSALAKVTVKYSAASIMAAIDKVLTDKRQRE